MFTKIIVGLILLPMAFGYLLESRRNPIKKPWQHKGNGIGDELHYTYVKDGFKGTDIFKK